MENEKDDVCRKIKPPPTEEDLENLKHMVDASKQEMEMAVQFYEVWKPAAYDDSLHDSLEFTRSAQAFLVIRSALRREFILSLFRCWDRNKKAIRMTWISNLITETSVINVLSRKKTMLMGDEDFEYYVDKTFSSHAEKIIDIINKYQQGGDGHETMKNLTHVRDQKLAHKQIKDVDLINKNITDQEIEEFYNDNLELISVLLSLVNNQCYDFNDVSHVFGVYSSNFWSNVKRGHLSRSTDDPTASQEE